MGGDAAFLFLGRVPVTDQVQQLTLTPAGATTSQHESVRGGGKNVDAEVHRSMPALVENALALIREVPPVHTDTFKFPEINSGEKLVQQHTCQCPETISEVKHGPLQIRIALLNGEEHTIDARTSHSVSGLKALIQEQLGYFKSRQTLLLGDTVLDSNTLLSCVGLVDSCTLTLVLSETIGQSALDVAHGKKSHILGRKIEYSGSTETFPKDKLTEFEFMSWQAACEADQKHGGMDWNTERWPDLGAWGLDFHWTTLSDGCRYEYWSSAPGDNEYGILVRVDANSMTGIGSGSDDGLELFEDVSQEVRNSSEIKELISSGWPNR